MELLFIRHTTVDIPKGICYGQSEVPLAATFEEETVSILKKIKDYAAYKFYSSPFERCVKLAQKLSPDFSLDKRLMELDFGDWELRNWDEINDDYALQWMENYFEMPTPNGESFQQLINRFNDFLKELKEDSVIVTHGGVIRAAYYILQGTPKQKLFDLDIPFGSTHLFSI